MSKTWKTPPVGKPRDPKPPEKGGHHNLLNEALNEELEDTLLEFEELGLEDWDYDFIGEEDEL